MPMPLALGPKWLTNNPWALDLVLTSSWIPERHIYQATVLNLKPHPQAKTRLSFPSWVSRHSVCYPLSLPLFKKLCSHFLPARVWFRSCVKPMVSHTWSCGTPSGSLDLAGLHHPKEKVTFKATSGSPPYADFREAVDGGLDVSPEVSLWCHQPEGACGQSPAFYILSLDKKSLKLENSAFTLRLYPGSVFIIGFFPFWLSRGLARNLLVLTYRSFL